MSDFTREVLEQVQRYIENLQWSSKANAHQKTLVEHNIRTFFEFLVDSKLIKGT